MENRILYSIEKSKNKIFIYNEKYFGKKIYRDENSITIYQNKAQLTKYGLKHKPYVNISYERENR